MHLFVMNHEHGVCSSIDTIFNDRIFTSCSLEGYCEVIGVQGPPQWFVMYITLWH